MIKGFLTTEEAATELDVSTGRIRQMIMANMIKGVKKVGVANLIPEKEIIRLKSTERKAGRPKKQEK